MRRAAMNRDDMGANMVRNVKLALSGLLMGLGATGVASAADMPLKARPLAAPGYNWTGCYIGGDVGGAWTRVDTSQASIDTVGAAFANYGREDDKGFMGGGQAGCDFQTTNLVFGVQGTFDFGNVKGSHALTDLPTFSEAEQYEGRLHGDGPHRLSLHAFLSRIREDRHGLDAGQESGVSARRCIA